MSGFSRLVHGETNIEFTKWWKRGLILSAVLVVISIGSLFTRGLNLGIDFEGGTSWEVTAPGVSVAEAREALGGVDESEAKIQTVGADLLRVQGAAESPERVTEVRQAVADIAGVDISEVNVSTVGPSWGGEITRSAVRALLIFLVCILIYLAWRLEWQMAIGAVVALIHDIIISVGVYSVFQFEVTPATVIAYLTILGYSIYDTIVVFDKVKENEGRVGMSGRMTYTDMMSMSMNQVLLRSLNTSICALIPVIALLVVGAGIMGAVTLEEFAIALFIGMIAGAYSSIFLAPPVVNFFKEREPRYIKVRERLAGVPGAASPVTKAATTSSTSTSASPAADSSAGSTATAAPKTYSGDIPPRPRKQGKKR